MAVAKDDYGKLRGPQKAAMFMLAIGEEHAAKMFEMMDDEEIRELSLSMSNLGTVQLPDGGAAVHGVCRQAFGHRFPGRQLRLRRSVC